MKKRKFLTLSLAVLTGWIVGPILYAALASLDSEEGRYGGDVEVGRLLDAYRARLPSGILFTSIVSNLDGEECGYEPDEILPDGIAAMAEGRTQRFFTPYEGYYALNRWIGQEKDEAYIGRIGENIRAKISLYEAEFLRRCIESTVLSPICMERVSSFSDGVERFPDEDPINRFLFVGGQDEEIVCLYLDGVAARRGLELANPED